MRCLDILQKGFNLAAKLNGLFPTGDFFFQFFFLFLQFCLKPTLFFLSLTSGFFFRGELSTGTFGFRCPVFMGPFLGFNFRCSSSRHRLILCSRLGGLLLAEYSILLFYQA